MGTQTTTPMPVLALTASRGIGNNNNNDDDYHDNNNNDNDSRTTDFELHNNRRTRGREGLHAFHIRLTPHLLRWLHKQSTTGAVCVSCAKSCASPKRHRGR